MNASKEKWSRRKVHPKPTKHFRLEQLETPLFPNRSHDFIGSKEIHVTNCCQIDGFLTALQFQLKVAPEFSKDCGDPAIIDFCESVKNAHNKTEICKARATFLYNCQEKIIGNVNVVSEDHIVIDMYGNDADLLTQLFGPLMRMELINECDNLRCDTRFSWTTETPLSIVTIE